MTAMSVRMGEVAEELEELNEEATLPEKKEEEKALQEHL